MFTGIISHLGKVKKFENKTFTFDAGLSFCKEIKKGSSVAVNGVCLTVETKSTDGTFKASVMPETLRRTTLADLKKGDLVNLELPLLASGRFEGHIVQGHVDGKAEVVNIMSSSPTSESQAFLSRDRMTFSHPLNSRTQRRRVFADSKIRERNSYLFKFRVSKFLARYLVEKGSIAVNGISLTVIESRGDFFTVGIIPYTWHNTMIKSLKVGDKVNIEVDILAKYLEKLMKAKNA